MRSGLTRILTLLLLLLTGASPAHAHIVSLRLGDFYAGAMHPFTDLQDLILWVGLGVLAGSLGAANGRWLVLVFPLGLLAGTAAAGLLMPATDGAPLNAAMIMMLGLLLAAALRIPVAALCAIAFGIALVRGAANAGDLAPQSDRLLFAAGLGCAGYVVITIVTALVAGFKRSEPEIAWRSIAIRSLGGWIAAIGLMMLGLAFA